uniref:Uncharacterized protein n=1 Tax=Aegilops tauschii subsp. strangulata TaxID=200361 RepID=A0A453KV55_AEGTS
AAAPRPAARSSPPNPPFPTSRRQPPANPASGLGPLIRRASALISSTACFRDLWRPRLVSSPPLWSRRCL